MIYYKHYKLYLEVNMLRRIVAATMIGALVLTSGCAFHNPFAKKAEPVPMKRWCRVSFHQKKR